MKSKKTIGLLLLVVAIWGAIAYQVYAHMTMEEPDVYIPVRKTASTEEDSVERYELALNYPDPFLKTVTSPPVTSSVVQEPKRKVAVATQPQVVPQQIPIDAWDKFYFMGSIYNGTRKSYIAVVKINGVEYMPRAGEVVDEFKILDIRKDSVEVECQAQRKFIKKKKDI